MASTSRTCNFLDFLQALQENTWLIADPSLPYGWLASIDDLYLQGTFLDFTPREVFTFSAVFFSLLLLLCPYSPPISLPHDAPVQQEVARRTVT